MSGASVPRRLVSLPLSIPDARALRARDRSPAPLFRHRRSRLSCAGRSAPAHGRQPQVVTGSRWAWAPDETALARGWGLISARAVPKDALFRTPNHHAGIKRQNRGPVWFPPWDETVFLSRRNRPATKGPVSCPQHEEVSWTLRRFYLLSSSLGLAPLPSGRAGKCEGYAAPRSAVRIGGTARERPSPPSRWYPK
jgi:hypothetical protein